ncbi:gliding motility-associated C-terminal domain-containing protein [Taibaiella chishuiensis]|uniref:Gliding motility-associated-like protein n=1 Tax=Taibaiella chishuiensis TaxID=1434707 RepID=A0A2P8CV56_9BACT|nr:gliding motility-associated C-terminal domain-containing protein [Taibaiella chishuiensis]PSK88845.1 gliding motility-associated-like protein [Taibaiella chishuiensis]
MKSRLPPHPASLKRITGFRFLLLGCIFTAGTGRAQNLLYNGSFTAQPASQWGAVAPGTVTETTNPESTYGGASATNIVAEVDAEATLRRTAIPVVAGQAYHFAYRYSRRTSNGPASNPNTVNVRLYNGANTFLAQSVAASNSSWTWQCFTGTFTPTTNAVALDMTSQNPAGVTSGTLVDDITLTPVNQPITATGTPCRGKTIILSAPDFPGDPDSKYTNHSWTGPNGFTATGSSVTLTNVQPLQSGVYTCTMTLNSCLQVSGQYQLTIAPYPTGIDVKTICQGKSYVFNGVAYTTANNTAKDTFQTAAGCDSIVTLNLTVTPYPTGTDVKTICQGKSYVFNGITYTTANNTAKDTFQTAAGCDSIVTLNLTVTPYLTGTANVTICQGKSYSFNGTTYTTSQSGLKDTLQTAAGCDSIVTLNLTVTPYLTGTDIKTICQGQSYVFNGITYTTANNTAKDTFQTAAGCDSIVTLNLTVTPYLTGTAHVTICQGKSYSFNGATYTTSQSGLKDTLQNAAGCDSIVTLNLTVAPYLTGTADVTICQGQGYSFNGSTYTTSQSGLKDTLQNAAGCDSIVTLNLTVTPYPTGTDVKTICQGKSYVFNGVTYTTTNNTAKDTFQTAAGCDSIVTLNLTVTPYLTGTAHVTICQGQSYSFNGTTYTTSQSGLKDTLQTAAGCDSIVTLNLTVTPYPTGIDVKTICQGQSYLFNGVTYTTSQSGLKDTLQTAAGCDSIVTLNLTVSPYLTGTDIKTICQGQSYLFNGVTYTTSNSTARDTLTTAGGCDSIVTLNLTVSPYLTGTANITICQGQSYSFNGATYTTSQSGLKDTLQTVAGCDSIVTLNLTVTPYLTGTDVKTICQGQSYLFNGVTYTTSNSTAKDTVTTAGGCDSIVTLNLTVTPYLTGTADVTICQGQSYSFNGSTYTTSQSGLKDTLQTAAGCDSIVTLNLTVTPYLTGTDVKTICQGQSYLFNGVMYTTSNSTARDTLTTAGGCDSIVTLNLTVSPYLTGTDIKTICQGQSYVFNGVTYTTTNNTAKDTFLTAAGCDSIVTLNLTVSPYFTGTDVKTICQGQSYLFNGVTYTTSNSTARDTLTTAGGCDSIVTLNLTVTPYLTGTANVTICQGQSYSFNGSTYTTSQSGLKDTLQTAAGCDSIVTLNLTVSPYLTGTDVKTICQGQSYVFNGVTYTTANNTAKDTFQTAAGCDSIVTLNLTVTPYLTGTDIKTICQGQSYLFNGITYTTSNSTARDTLATAGGCDSIVTLNLTVSPYLTGTDVRTICQGQSYLFNGVTYTTSNSTARDTLTTAGGCDSIVTLNLTVTPYLTGTANITICQGQGYSFNGITYTTSQSGLKDTLQTVAGCDSIVTLNLTVSPYLTGTDVKTICQGQGYLFNGVTYTTSNSTARDTLTTAGGCDSIVTLNLTVTPYLTGTVHVTICQGQGYSFNGSTYTTSQSGLKDTLQTVAGCDSIVTLNLTVTPYLAGIDEQVICQGQAYVFNGITYTAANNTATDTLLTAAGCDSIVTLQLTVNPLPTVGISIDTERSGAFCTGDSVRLRATGATDYTWSDYRGAMGNGETITVLLTQAGNTFRVKGRDDNSCTDTAQIAINTEPCCKVYMPNAFSPNGDGLNDEIGPVTQGHPLGYRFRVFNRWGQLVFVSYKIEERWKGTMNGAPADMGTYYYVVGGTCVDGTPIHLQGDIVLIR